MTVRPARDELKFLIHHTDQQRLRELWGRYLRPAPFTNEHCVTPILSQYYDSPRLEFYHEKIDGIALRNKVRLRTYARRFEDFQTAFMEIKQRIGDKVVKFRYPIPDFSVAWLDVNHWHFDDKQMQDAFLFLQQRYALRPSAQTYYQREAWEGAVEADLRVTFDTCLIGLYPGEQLSRGVLLDRSRQLMPDTLTILEVKATDGIPGWVYEGVRAVELRQQTIPKYISAVEALGLVDLSAAGVYA